MNKISIPINTSDDLCSTITSGCYKYGSATLIGGKYGTTLTCIMEILYKEDTDTANMDEGCDWH